MPVKIGYDIYYWWSAKETAQYNTERHQVFREELYPHASLPREEFKKKLEEFKEKNFDLLDSEKTEGVRRSVGLRQPSPNCSRESDSKLNNKLEG